MPIPPPDDWDVEYDNFDEWSYPEGFLPNDLTDEDAEFIEKVADITGEPVQSMVSTIAQLGEQGRAGQIRAASFSSGVDALRWLFKRGLFLYSNIVKFSDGTWGVAIGDSPQPEVGNGTSAGSF